MSVDAARRAVAALRILDAVGSAGRTSREVSDAERDVLRAWPGWGPVAKALDPAPQGSWVAVAEQIAEATANDERILDTAQRVVDTSFYTPRWLARAAWGVLVDAGFAGGRVLEPGCGHGRFLDAAPEGIDVAFTCVEPDAAAAQIAELLHPDARIEAAPLQDVTLPRGAFDAVIGNVPFSDAAVYDSISGYSESLHNYVIGRAVEATREGGYLVLVTSRYTLDSSSTRIAGVRLVGAVRMPQQVFTSEGAQVVTDLLVLRREAGHIVTGPRIEDGGGYRVSAGGRVRCHEWWQQHPELVAGQMTETAFSRSPLRVSSGDPVGDVTRSITSLSPLLSECPLLPAATGALPPIDDVPLADADGRPEGAFHLADDGTVLQVRRGAFAPVRKSRELVELIALRDATVALFDAESDPDAADDDIAPLRAAARQLWEKYVAAYGPLNRGTMHEGTPDPDTGRATFSWRRPRMGGFRADPAYLRVMAIERYDAETGTCAPAAILTRRVNARPRPIEHVDSPAEALAVSLGETGLVDIARIRRLLGLDTDRVAVAALGDLVYPDPQRGGRLVPARDYLSGNVRARLAAARRAAGIDSTYRRNVAALERVVPADIPTADIDVALGAPWIATSDLRDFCRDVLDGEPTIEHTPAVAAWTVSMPWRISETARSTYGTERINAFELLRLALNGRAPVVWDEIVDDGQRRKVRNHEQTVAAIDRMNALGDRFAAWLWEDADRAARLTRTYNDRFNSHVARVPDGAHLTFPGLSESVSLWQHQRDIVDQIVSTPATLCGHAVGGGKTLSAIAAAWTLRRFGLARKPLIIVPNHLLEQYATEAQQAFPTGRFLIAGKDDLAGDGRRLFAARCAAEEWDAVVMTHAGFTSIPVHPDTEAAWYEQQIWQYREALRGNTSHTGSKDIARKVRSLQARLDRLRDKPFDHRCVLFEHLAIDHISVDEAHAFKRLDAATNGREFSTGSSKRATDLLLKVSALRERDPDRPHLALFTATPWTNSIIETFTWQTYLQPDSLREAGVHQFDAWAATFVERQTVIEVAPDGSGFRYATRPLRMRNLPELLGMFGHVAHVLTQQDLGLDVPEHHHHTITVSPNAAQRAYIASLVARADAIRTGTVPAEDDNMLAICGDGRRVALDPPLVGVAADSPKLARAADIIADCWHADADTDYGGDRRGALHVVFCDQGTPHPERGEQTYGRLRALLVAAAVPASVIRYVHDAATDKAKAALFAACRDGRVQILIGSTAKCGIGTNIQTRLRTIHHLDAPWLPAVLQQRDGRGVRPHNRNPRVDSYRHVTERSFEAYIWQAIARKSRFIEQMMRLGSGATRTIDDISNVTVSYEQVKAAATGNPLVLEHATLVAAARRLRALRAVARQSVTAAQKRIDAHASAAQQRAETLAAIRGALSQPRPGDVGDDLSLAASRISRRITGDAWSYGSIQFTSAGLDVRVQPRGAVSWSQRDAEIVMTVRHDDVPIAAIELRRSELRRSNHRVAAYLAEQAAAVIADLPRRERDLAAQSAAAERDYAQAQRTVAEHTFARERELREAERRIVEIESLMHQHAEQPRAG